MRIVINNIRRLWQGDPPPLTYATNSRLFAFDIPWDEGTVMDQFRQGLHEDSKSLTKAISGVM